MNFTDAQYVSRLVPMNELLNFGEIVAMNAYVSPDKIGARDLTRSLTFREWNDRSSKLANALVGVGLEKGDRIAVLAYNCLEWLEIYAAVAKAGLVVVPINFRLVGSEVRYIVENSEAKVVIVQDDLLDRVEAIRAERLIADDNYVHFGGRTPPGYRSYEDLVAAGARSEPSIETGPDDPYALLYTSGTTGKPKGVIRNSGSLVLLAYLVQADWGFSRNDLGLLVMPMCHANSLYFAYVFCRLRRNFLRLRPQKLRTGPSAEDACRRQIHFHLPGADALHHDARIARIREARAQCRERHQTPHLLRAGPPGHQAGGDGML
jgi:fatty-acyl-CoA synthase